jgi:hypothetical protein
MQTTTTTTQQLFEQIKALPSDSLSELATYIDFLRFKTGQEANSKSAERRLRVVKLRGVLKDYDFSPQELAEARREMWQRLETTEP